LWRVFGISILKRSVYHHNLNLWNLKQLLLFIQSKKVPYVQNGFSGFCMVEALRSKHVLRKEAQFTTFLSHFAISLHGIQERKRVDKEKNRVHSTTNEHIAKHIMPFDFSEAKKSNILLSGTNQQGKSLCAMAISDLLMRYVKSPWQVIVFDNVGHWKEKSSVPIFYKVSEATMRYVLPEHSIIYDISLLLPSYQKEFAEMVLNDLWKRKVEEKSKRWTLIVFEEFQLYAKNVRGNVSQNILRIMSVGANHKIRCLGITPDLSLVDCAFK
jgi:hypothetical protein